MPVEELEKIPFDEHAANAVETKHDKFVSLLLDYEFLDLCGNVGITKTRPPQDYPHFRSRDIHILHKLSVLLPQMDNDAVTATLLNHQLNHSIVNTLEGSAALEALIKNIFPVGPIPESFSIHHLDISDLETFKRGWKEK